MKALYAYASHDLRPSDCDVESHGPGQVRVTIAPGGTCAECLRALHATGKKLSLTGFFRFHEGFRTAIVLMQNWLTDAAQQVTHSFKLTDFAYAFAMAQNRTRAIKVQLGSAGC